MFMFMILNWYYDLIILIWLCEKKSCWECVSGSLVVFKLDWSDGQIKFKLGINLSWKVEIKFNLQ